jgi:hypothetical protein
MNHQSSLLRSGGEVPTEVENLVEEYIDRLQRGEAVDVDIATAERGSAHLLEHAEQLRGEAANKRTLGAR